MEKLQILKTLHNGLIVSCQALTKEPMYSEQGGIMPKFAKAAQLAGAVGIRANSVRDIKEIKEAVDLPIIGIIKIDYEGTDVYITPSMKEIDELHAIGTDIIALDCTINSRKEGVDAVEFIKAIKKKYPNQLLMADCSTLEEGKAAVDAGIDFVGTTMSGYTNQSKTESSEPDYELVKALSEYSTTPVVAEGRVHTPQQAVKMLESGAYCVVVGGAITRPLEIAQRFTDAVEAYKKEMSK